MRTVLAAHDELLHNAIEAHGGWLFKHTGDGVCAAFASPRSAVDAAVAAQLNLELPVRMGIATGEAELLLATPERRGDNGWGRRAYVQNGRKLARQHAAWQMLACCRNAGEHDG
jgi:hypothetical protein